jgi:hypothetical protein
MIVRLIVVCSWAVKRASRLETTDRLLMTPTCGLGQVSGTINHPITAITQCSITAINHSRNHGNARVAVGLLTSE